jgi:hypothetical protein
VAALGFLMTPGAASACRFSVAPPRIAGEFQAIVVAEIDVARDTGVNNAWVWEIEAHVTEIVAGEPAAATYGFRHSTGTNGCSPDPPTGLFVLYIANTANGERVVEALPLERALNVDPRVNDLLQIR